jgi:predicted Zn-dependent peptidase
MHDPYAAFEKTILPNGLRIYTNTLYREHAWIVVEIVIHAGSRLDPSGKSGLAHFTEHAVSENIPGINYREANDYLESVGGNGRFGSTSSDATRYSFRIPADKDTLRKALDIFGSMLFLGRLTENIERERSVIKQEFNRRFPFRERHGWNMATLQSLFPGHWLGSWMQTLGIPEEFLLISQNDLQSFYNTHYTPANTSMVIVGGISPDEVSAIIAHSPFGINAPGERNPIPVALDTLPVPTGHLLRVSIADHVSFKMQAMEYKTTWSVPASFVGHACSILAPMLDRLLTAEVRERHALTYSIGTSPESYLDVGTFEVSAAIGPELGPRMDEIITKCIRSIPAQRALFDQKKRAAMQSCFMADVTGRILADCAIGHLIDHNRIITLQERWNALESIKFEQVAAMTEALRPDRQFTCVLGP